MTERDGREKKPRLKAFSRDVYEKFIKTRLSFIPTIPLVIHFCLKGNGLDAQYWNSGGVGIVGIGEKEDEKNRPDTRGFIRTNLTLFVLCPTPVVNGTERGPSLVPWHFFFSWLRPLGQVRILDRIWNRVYIVICSAQEVDVSDSRPHKPRSRGDP